jgi:Flp pilus assembly protein CpaB
MPLIRTLAPGGHGGGPLSTRRGTVAIAAVVAVIAGAILIVFLDNYRKSVAAEGQPARVLVANGLVAKGASGEILASERMVRMVQVRESDLAGGAISDPAQIRGMVAVHEILPGQQLRMADFTTAREPVAIRLRAGDRAIALPVDAVHGLSGPVQAGSHVDVLVGFNGDSTSGGSAGLAAPVIKKILDDILVLRAPVAGSGGSGGSGGGNVVLRVPARFAPHVAYAADNGVLWLTLRSAVGSRDTKSDIVDLAKVLISRKPVALNAGEER